MENDGFILNRNSNVKVTYIGTGQFQLASGKWVDAILYKYKGVYKMMEASEFIRLAEQDRSSLVENGEVDTSPIMQNSFEKNGILDTITDTIGPGYEPELILDMSQDQKDSEKRSI